MLEKFYIPKKLSSTNIFNTDGNNVTKSYVF